MKCSVVIPYAFSTESAVRLFHSLENQDFSKSDYELIFVNYGNQDSFEEYVDKHSHHLRVRCISFYGKSVGEAKNLGIRKASGELVIFLNGDEILRLLSHLVIACIRGNCYALDVSLSV